MKRTRELLKRISEETLGLKRAYEEQGDNGEWIGLDIVLKEYYDKLKELFPNMTTHNVYKLIYINSWDNNLLYLMAENKVKEHANGEYRY